MNIFYEWIWFLNQKQIESLKAVGRSAFLNKNINFDSRFHMIANLSIAPNNSNRNSNCNNNKIIIMIMMIIITKI